MNENTVRRLALDCSSTQEATSTVHTQMYIFPYPDRSQTAFVSSHATPRSNHGAPPLSAGASERALPPFCCFAPEDNLS